MVHIIFCIKCNCSLMEHGGKNNCFEMVISLVFHCNEILQKNIHCFLTTYSYFIMLSFKIKLNYNIKNINKLNLIMSIRIAKGFIHGI